MIRGIGDALSSTYHGAQLLAAALWVACKAPIHSPSTVISGRQELTHTVGLLLHIFRPTG